MPKSSIFSIVNAGLAIFWIAGACASAAAAGSPFSPSNHHHGTIGITAAAAAVDGNKVPPPPADLSFLPKGSSSAASQQQTSRFLQQNVCADTTSTVIEFPNDGTNQVTVSTITATGSASEEIPCAAIFDDAYASFILVGTGNPFLVTTCSSTQSTALVDLKLSRYGGSATGTDGECLLEDFACIEDIPATFCPTNSYAEATIWPTEPGVIYQISAFSGSGAPVEFGITFGEIVDSPPSNDQCTAAIPLEFTDGSVEVLGTTVGALPEDFGPCFSGEKSPSVWYTVQGNGNKFVATTCADETEFPVGLLVGIPSDGQCDSDYECRASEREFVCGSEFGIQDISWVSQPGETYFIQASSTLVKQSGNFKLTITEEVPTPDEICSIAQSAFFNDVVGSKCDFCEPLGDGSTFLECSDPCWYCDEDETVCVTNSFEQTFVSFEAGSNRKEVIEYVKGMDGTIIYETFTDGSCTLEFDGAMCTSCTIQPCGKPMINCANVDPNMPVVLDLCQDDGSAIDASSFDMSASPFYGFISDAFDTCTFFPSRTKCEELSAIEEAANEDFACRCILSSVFGDAILECETTCGVFCNTEETVCGIQGENTQITAFGDVDSKLTIFEYLIGGEGVVGETLGIEYFGDDCFIFGPSSLGFSCNCEMKACPGGDDSKAAMSCTDFFGTPTFDYDFCAPSVVDTGIGEAWSVGEFDICLDKSPSNSVCTAATPIIPDGTVVNDRIELLSGKPEDPCVGGGFGGLWYEMVGDGKAYTVDPCVGDSLSSTRLSVLRGCASDSLPPQCVAASPFSCEPVSFYAEQGVTYKLRFSDTFQEDAADVSFSVSPAAPAMQLCYEELVELGDEYGCTCTFFPFCEESNLECETACGEFCNTEETACLTAKIMSTFDADGKTRATETYTYTSGREGTEFEVSYEFGDNPFCFVSFTRDNGTTTEFCSSCEQKECPDGETDGIVVDCSSIDEGATFDTCDVITVPGNSIYEIFETDEFTTCYANGTVAPTGSPSASPSLSIAPSTSPTSMPTSGPTLAPTAAPVTSAPTAVTSAPTDGSGAAVVAHWTTTWMISAAATFLAMAAFSTTMVD